MRRTLLVGGMLAALSVAACKPAAPVDPAAAPAPAPAVEGQVDDPAPQVVTGPGSSPITRFSANGFSPAWRAEVDGNSVKLDVPEHARVDPGFTTVNVERAPYATGAEYRGKDGDVDFVLTIDGRQRCRTAGDANGKTDREFSATLAYGATTYHGCADAMP